MARNLIIGSSGGIGQAFMSILQSQNTIGLSRADGLDVTDQASVRDVLGRISGPFDRIILTFGILAPNGESPEKALTTVSQDTIEKVFAVNTFGVAYVLSALPFILDKQCSTRIGILTARVGSIEDNRLGGWYSYRASKAAANQIIKTAATEFARTRKNAVIAALHPGTVDTTFTANYPKKGKLSPEESARRLITVLDGLTPAETGCFYDYAGQSIPW